jgi:hypothetical protein
MDEKEGSGDKAGSEKNTRTSQVEAALTANAGIQLPPGAFRPLIDPFNHDPL